MFLSSVYSYIGNHEESNVGSQQLQCRLNVVNQTRYCHSSFALFVPRRSEKNHVLKTYPFSVAQNNFFGFNVCNVDDPNSTWWAWKFDFSRSLDLPAPIRSLLWINSKIKRDMCNRDLLGTLQTGKE